MLLPFVSNGVLGSQGQFSRSQLPMFHIIFCRLQWTHRPSLISMNEFCWAQKKDKHAARINITLSTTHCSCLVTVTKGDHLRAVLRKPHIAQASIHLPPLFLQNGFSCLADNNLLYIAIALNYCSDSSWRGMRKHKRSPNPLCVSSLKCCTVF